MALIDIDYFRRQPLGWKGAANIQADILEEAIAEASTYVEDYLDRKILITSYVQRIVGNRRYVLILDNYPIASLTGVSYTQVTGEVGTHSLLDFLVHNEEGMIEMIDKRNVFRGDRVYTVSYTAGYATVPGPIKRAVALQTVQLLRPMYGGPSPDAPEVVPFADELIISLLEKYRRKRLS
jgi:hypothetical protein